MKIKIGYGQRLHTLEAKQVTEPNLRALFRLSKEDPIILHYDDDKVLFPEEGKFVDLSEDFVYMLNEETSMKAFYFKMPQIEQDVSAIGEHKVVEAVAPHSGTYRITVSALVTPKTHWIRYVINNERVWWYGHQDNSCNVNLLFLRTMQQGENFTFSLEGVTGHQLTSVKDAFICLEIVNP